MEPILKTVAREYSFRYPDLKRICFLFPNKRCGLYLKKYFIELGKKSEDFPHILTISELVSQITHKTEAGRIVQLFTLFKAYKKVLGEEANPDFDAFRNWGETVLNDFNTVDMNCVDPLVLFKNVKDYREISSNFLSEEQKEVMKEYFGVENFDDSLEFWKNFEDPKKISELQKKFLNLWQILAPLHDKFIKDLSERGLGSSGYIYKLASEIIAKKGRSILPYYKIVVIGFNALSESERIIFKNLQKQIGVTGYDDFADFIWDMTGPFLNSTDISASKFVSFNKKNFPMPEWLISSFQKSETFEYPEIEIISSPTNTAQTKIAGEILKSYDSKEGKLKISEAEVALILPEESLLSNTLFSLPDNIGDINLTMGYSLKLAPISSFMSSLRRLYSSMIESDKGSIFYARDLKLFLSNSYAYLLFHPEEIEILSDYIENYHKIRVSLNEISSFISSANELLKLPSKKTAEPAEIFTYIFNLFAKLKCSLLETRENFEEDPEYSQIKIYEEYVEALQETINYFNIKSSPLSVLSMIEKLITNEKIGFEGEPLSGLQVMGTLETRSLDFSHVIILSMNEGVMPRKANISTFIPETLRKAYGLPPARYAEEIFSYYFYRIISRAKKVTLVYDGSTVSGNNGGVSRYILQLRHFVPKSKLKESVWQFKLQNRTPQESSILKTPEIFEVTEIFSSKEKNRKNFSASSLNTYRECQVRFFLQNLLNIDSDPTKGEFMDSIEIGDVLHEVMMQLYLPLHLRKQLLKDPVTIDRAFIENILSEPHRIKKLVVENILKIYYKEESSTNKQLESGVTEMIAQQISELIEDILRFDLTLTPFNLYGCEISENLRVRLSSGREVNFRFAIDRLDEINFNGEQRLRIVDYKTGKRKRKARNLEEVFEGGYGSEQIFQLFTYAWLLGKRGFTGWENVLTEIYFVPDLVKGERGFPEIEGEKITSFQPFVRDFNEKIERMIESIFTDPLFLECSDYSNCTFCGFKNFCRK